MFASHRTWTEFLRRPADPLWWAKKAIDYQKERPDDSASSVDRARRLTECIWLISSQKLSNREAIKLLVSRSFLGRKPSRTKALFTSREYRKYLRPADTNLDRPRTRTELVRFLLRRRFTYYPEWMREKASRKREVDLDSLPEMQIVEIAQEFVQLVSQGRSDAVALQGIESRHSYCGVGQLPEPLSPVAYVKRANHSRRTPLPDDFVEWAAEQAVSFFQSFGAHHPAAEGGRTSTPAVSKDARIERLRVQAERLNPEAQYNLAKAFLHGDGVRQDLRRGLFWIVLARRSGHSDAELLFEKIREGKSGAAFDRLLMNTEAAADQYKAFSDVVVPPRNVLIARPSDRQNYVGEAPVEASSR